MLTGFQKTIRQCIHTKFLTLKALSQEFVGYGVNQVILTLYLGDDSLFGGDKTKPLGKCQQAIILIPRIGGANVGFQPNYWASLFMHMSGNREGKGTEGLPVHCEPSVRWIYRYLFITWSSERSHFDKQITVAFGDPVTNSEPFQCLVSSWNVYRRFLSLQCTVKRSSGQRAPLEGKAWRNIYRTWL